MKKLYDKRADHTYKREILLSHSHTNTVPNIHIVIQHTQLCTHAHTFPRTSLCLETTAYTRAFVAVSYHTAEQPTFPCSCCALLSTHTHTRARDRV